MFKFYVAIAVKQFVLITLATILTTQTFATVYNVTVTTDGYAVNQLRGALEDADLSAGPHTINVAAGTYNLTLGQIIFGSNAQNITITGAGSLHTIINMTAFNADRIFMINATGLTASVQTTISGITFQGGRLTSDFFGGGAIIAGGPNNSLSLSSCVFNNNTIDATSDGNGGAIHINGGGTLSIDQCTFTNNICPTGEGGALYYFLPNTNSDNVNLSGSLSITSTTFSNNSTTYSGGGGGAISIGMQGGAAGSTSSISILKNVFTNNHADTENGAGGAIVIVNSFSSTNTAFVNYNRFVGNTANVNSTSALAMAVTTGSVNASNNWWGCNGGAGTCSDKAAMLGVPTSGTLTVTPYLQLTNSASKTTICSGSTDNTTVITAGFIKNSAGNIISSSNLSAVTGVPVTFSATLGNLSSAQTTIQSNGTATVTYTSNGTSGTGSVNSVVDNVPVSDQIAKVSITVNAAVSITTQPQPVAQCIGNTSSFSVIATGSGTLSYQWYKGLTALTNGATVNGSTISGATTATLGIANSTTGDNATNYNVVVTNGCGPVTSGNVALTINPVITSNTISGDQSVCASSSPSALTGSLPAGGSGSYTYSWESSTASSEGGFNPVAATNTQTYSPSAVSVSTWFRRVVTSGGCSMVSNAVLVSVIATGTWQGITSTGWNTASNWCGGVPTATTNVVIPSSVNNMPSITGNEAANDIQIGSGAVLALTFGSFTINGAVSGTGTITAASTANLTIGGTTGGSAGTLNFTTGSSNLSSLTINRTGASASVIIGSPLHIFDVLTVTNGTLNTGDNMVLKSNVTSTARVSALTGTGVISGMVTVERYVPSRRAWRLITAPLSNANSIRAAWQNGGSFAAGTGTFITGPGGTNGLDNGNGYSLKTYNTGTQLLENVNNTEVSLSASTGSADNKGYFLFVRGDRDPANLTPPNTNSTTLSAKGNLQQGTQTFTASAIAGHFTLVGNPYASPVDFSSLTRNNIVKRFYAWDPAVNTVGGYVLLDDFDNDGTYSITPATTQTAILQSGQGFFVETIINSAASLTFLESSKSSLSTTAGFRTNNGSSEILRSNLYAKNADNTTALVDGVLSEYNEKYNAVADIQDAVKMANINENLAIQRGDRSLSIERSPLASGGDTLFLKLSNTTNKNYRFEFVPSNFSSEVSAWLEDTYLQTSTAVSMTEPTVVDFKVTSDTASATAERFRIVFKAAGTLPITFSTIKAIEKDRGIKVDWHIATESNISHYEVEKSLDGRAFKKLADITIAGNNSTNISYSSFDANPSTGNNYYRIKVIEKTGGFTYSEVVNVKMGNAKGDITVYPNPISNGLLKLQLTNQPKGDYNVDLYNGVGQKVFTKKIVHGGGSVSQSVQLPRVVSKGIYQLQIANRAFKKTQQLIIK